MGCELSKKNQALYAHNHSNLSVKLYTQLGHGKEECEVKCVLFELIFGPFAAQEASFSINTERRRPFWLSLSLLTTCAYYPAGLQQWRQHAAEKCSLLSCRITEHLLSASTQQPLQQPEHEVVCLSHCIVEKRTCRHTAGSAEIRTVMHSHLFC